MTERTDLLTASRVDLTLILLPEIGWLAASCTLAASEVPLEVAARVLSLPLRRRRVDVVSPGAFLDFGPAL